MEDDQMEIQINQSQSVEEEPAGQQPEEEPPVHYQSVPADLTKYTVLQVNGCRMNKALNWTDPEPQTSCELFVKNIPRTFKGEDLWPLFERYGRIYNIRVLMDYTDYNRGFAYVKFSRESEAVLCMELMNHYFVFSGYRLHIQRSVAKSRLFANHLPKEVPVKEIQDKFKEIFPEIRDVVVPHSGPNHRGFAFLVFGSHHEAVGAKKLVYSGVLEIWGAQVKINWARPQEHDSEEDDMNVQNARLFIKPFVRGGKEAAKETTKEFFKFLGGKVGLAKVVKFDLRGGVGILKVLSQRDGEEFIRQLNGETFNEQKLQVDWYRERNTDVRRYSYCKVFELTCTANMWTNPVILFGRIFPERNEQYAACFTTFRGHIFSAFFKISLCGDLNITSRISEIFLSLIEDTGYLPCYNYVLVVKDETAKVVGFLQDLRSMTFYRTYKGRDVNFNFYWAEMLELSWAIQRLVKLDPRYLYKKYQDAIDNVKETEDGYEMYIVDGISTNNRIFASVYNDQSNMTLLLLCDKVTVSNQQYMNAIPTPYSTYRAQMCYGKHPQSIQLSQLGWAGKNKENNRDNEGELQMLS